MTCDAHAINAQTKILFGYVLFLICHGDAFCHCDILQWTNLNYIKEQRKIQS